MCLQKLIVTNDEEGLLTNRPQSAIITLWSCVVVVEVASVEVASVYNGCKTARLEREELSLSSVRCPYDPSPPQCWKVMGHTSKAILSNTLKISTRAVHQVNSSGAVPVQNIVFFTGVPDAMSLYVQFRRRCCCWQIMLNSTKAGEEHLKKVHESIIHYSDTLNRKVSNVALPMEYAQSSHSVLGTTTTLHHSNLTLWSYSLPYVAEGVMSIQPTTLPILSANVHLSHGTAICSGPPQYF